MPDKAFSLEDGVLTPIRKTSVGFWGRTLRPTDDLPKIHDTEPYGLRFAQKTPTPNFNKLK